MNNCDEIDALGLLCPLPVLKLRKRIKVLKKGDIISLRADDPAAVIDVPHFCTEAGHTLLEMIETKGGTLYRVQKG